MKPKRTRSKACDICEQTKATLYRISVKNEGWLFACGRCTTKLKKEHPDTYRYGGTWKANKRH